MKTAASGVNGGRNGLIPSGIVPMNRSEQSRFGVWDVAIIAGFALLAGGFLALVLSVALR
jgi:hypothetical protein